MEMLFSYWSIEIHEIIRGIPTVRDYGPRRVVSLPGITSALNLSSCFLAPGDAASQGESLLLQGDLGRTLVGHLEDDIVMQAMLLCHVMHCTW